MLALLILLFRPIFQSIPKLILTVKIKGTYSTYRKVINVYTMSKKYIFTKDGPHFFFLMTTFLKRNY